MTLKDVTANTCTEYTSKVIKWTTVFWLYRHMKTKKKPKKKPCFQSPKLKTNFSLINYKIWTTKMFFV